MHQQDSVVRADAVRPEPLGKAVEILACFIGQAETDRRPGIGVNARAEIVERLQLLAGDLSGLVEDEAVRFAIGGHGK